MNSDYHNYVQVLAGYEHREPELPNDDTKIRRWQEGRKRNTNEVKR